MRCAGAPIEQRRLRVGATTALVSTAFACATAPIERIPAEEVLGLPRPVGLSEHDASGPLLESLQHFGEVSEELRRQTPRGAAMPPAQADAWAALLTDVDRFLRRDPTVLDLVRARLWLQTQLEADGGRYGDVPAEVALRAQRTVAELTFKLVTLQRGRRLARVSPTSLSWPLEPVVVTSPWGHRTHPIHGDYRFHAGVDLEATRSQPVTAAGPGVVAFAGWNSGHGKQVEVQHDEHLSTRYSHLQAWAVRAGAVVKRGDLIGWAGMTGTATGVHLHFELRMDGEAIDPEVELQGPYTVLR